MVKGRVLPLTLVSRSNSILGKNEDVSKELDFAGCLRGGITQLGELVRS